VFFKNRYKKCETTRESFENGSDIYGQNFFDFSTLQSIPSFAKSYAATPQIRAVPLRGAKTLPGFHPFSNTTPVLAGESAAPQNPPANSAHISRKPAKHTPTSP
jgi:hypothetical protein